MAVACEAAAMLAGVDAATRRAARDYGMKIGTAFQVADDLLDLEASEEKLGKPQGHDIKEGKLTLPLIVALRQAGVKQRARIQELILKEELAETEMAEVVQFIKDGGGLEYTRRRAQKLVEEARLSLQALPAGLCRDAMGGLADYIIRRDY
jgi:octaprenyl-diphosphate synthase